GGISYEEAADYLIEKYVVLYEVKPGEPIRIERPSLRKSRRRIKAINNPIIQATSPYLTRRGISAEVQAEAGVGYDEQFRGFTAIPWLTEGGEVANVFYRKTSGKQFFYNDEGTPISRLLFGIDRVNAVAVICEGAIDALSWEPAGYSALAVGGAHMSRDQIELIKRSPIKRLYLGGDSDRQGAKLDAQVAEELRGYVDMFTLDYGKERSEERRQ